MEFPQTRLMLAQFGNKVKSHGYRVSNSCIPEDSHNIIVEYDCTCARNLPNITCHETSPSDPTIPIVLWSISAFILFVLILELFAVRFRRPFLDNFFGKLVFSMGIASSIVTQLCTVQYLQENSHNITVWYNICFGGVSVFFVVFGYHFLFVKSRKDNIGSHDRGMGLVVAIISTFLVGLEIVLIVMVWKRENLSTPFFIYLLVFAFEKIVQVGVYIGVRGCKPHEDFKKGAVFYFNFLSFLNFTLWLNRIPFMDIEIYDEVSHGYLLQYVDDTFKALVLDYRLLCALLFLEHALAIDEGRANPQNDVQADEEFQMPKERYLYTAIGVGIGLAFLGLQAGNAAKFWNQSLPVVVSLFPILVDLALVVLGYLLMRNVHTPVLHKKKVNLVLLMVTSMGAVSIVYLFSFGLLSLTSFKHDEPVSYVKWSACVFLARGSSLLVLLLVYTGIPVSTMESRENFNARNYLFVSALCCGLFARFIGSILDEFNGIMDKIAHQHLESNKLRALRDLFAIGPLFQLAASLHLALHFLLMLCRLYEQPKVDQANEQANAGQRDGNAEPIGGNYGAVNATGVVEQPNGHGAVQPNGARQQTGGPVQSNGHPNLQGDREDSAHGSSGVQQFIQSDNDGCPTADEHTRLLQFC